MSKTSRNVLNVLTQDYLWIRPLLPAPQSDLTVNLTKSAEALRNLGDEKVNEFATEVGKLESCAMKQRSQATLRDVKKRIFS